jgi:nitroreductase
MGLLRNVLDTTRLFPFAERLYFKWIEGKRLWNTHVFLPVLANVPFVARLWYGLFSPTFKHEMAMHVKARLSYYRRLEGTDGNTWLLRRNIHRLEKGLLMEERKPIFALDYITETVTEYLKVKQFQPESSMLDWADDILVSYFAAVSSHPTVDAAKVRFMANRHKPEGCALEFVPYISTPYQASEQVKVEAMFTDLVFHRKSVRIFDRSKTLSRDLLDKAVVMAAQTPSSCNRQPFEFKIFDDPQMVKQLSAIPGGTKGFSAGIPALCVVVGKMDVSPSPGDRHLMYVDGSLAAMTFMLALESLGLASCPINWPDNDDIERKFRKLVTIQTFERPIMFIAIGFAAPDGLVAFSKRKSLDELRSYN